MLLDILLYVGSLVALVMYINGGIPTWKKINIVQIMCVSIIFYVFGFYTATHLIELTQTTLPLFLVTLIVYLVGSMTASIFISAESINEYMKNAVSHITDDEQEVDEEEF